MKKTLIILSTFLVFLLIYFLQANFFISFTIAGIKPNLFIVYVLFLGLFAGRRVGTVSRSVLRNIARYIY